MNEKNKKIMLSFTILTFICIPLTYTHLGHTSEHQIVHSRSRSIQRNVPCTRCGKLFTRRGNMKRHVATCHTKSKDYQYPCSTCGRKFGRADGLQNHQAYHAKEKRLTCTTCSSTYFDSSSLSKHRKTKKHKDAIAIASLTALSTSAHDDTRKPSLPSPLPTLQEHPQTISHLHPHNSMFDQMPRNSQELWLVVSPVVLYVPTYDNHAKKQ